MRVVDLEGTVEAITNRLAADGLTDGLPIVPPTVEAVEAMLTRVGRDPDDVLGRLAPLEGEATLALIAANAVMAGCLPQHFPVVLAAVSAVIDQKYNLAGVQTTTNPVGPVVIVNGPVRGEGEYNGGANALGQGWRANAATGRALQLVLRNIGGAMPGKVDLATLGYPGKYTFCFAENEERSPWEPLHVERGFKALDSCVTVAAASGTVNIMGGDRIPEELVDKIAGSLRLVGSNDHALGHGSPLLVISPEHAAVIAKGGYTKSSLKATLVERSRLPWDALSSHNQGLARVSRRVDLLPEGYLTLVDNLDDFLIVVSGGAGVHSCFVMSFGDSEPITRRIGDDSASPN